MNNHLNKLHLAFDDLYRDIRLHCKNCKDHDCEGYLWLLPEEAEMLYTQHIPIIEVNEGLYFVHSFQEIDGQIAVDIPKPPCVWCKDGKCMIYPMRPLVCRMYPVGLSFHDNELLLVLHQDCRFSRELSGDAKISFFRTVVDILQSVPSETVREITDVYLKIDEISSFPDGQNNYEIIATIDEILQKGDIQNVQV